MDCCNSAENSVLLFHVLELSWKPAQQRVLLQLSLLWYNVACTIPRSWNSSFNDLPLEQKKFCPLVVSNHPILTRNYQAGMFFLPWQIGELNYYALMGATFVNLTKSVDICTNAQTMEWLLKFCFQNTPHMLWLNLFQQFSLQADHVNQYFISDAQWWLIS